MDSSEFGTSRPNRNQNQNDSDEEDNNLVPFEDQADQLIGMSEMDLPEEDEEEGEDIMANAEDDYRAIPELDRFEERGIDDESIDEDVDDIYFLGWG